jgi:hypothetical protein
MGMKLCDPDTYVTWTRCEEPGENPTWESQCGIIEQIGFGMNAMYRGFSGPEKLIVLPHRFTFNSIKKAVEEQYKRYHRLTWAYEDNED